MSKRPLDEVEVRDLINDFRNKFDGMFVEDAAGSLDFDDKVRVAILSLRQTVAEIQGSVETIEKVFNLMVTQTGTKQ